jgi:type I restriction enzyme R subunit
MSGPANNAFASPNFAFLMKYDEVLVRHAALAERYVFDDPNPALIKLRLAERRAAGKPANLSQHPQHL